MSKVKSKIVKETRRNHSIKLPQSALFQCLILQKWVHTSVGGISSLLLLVLSLLFTLKSNSQQSVVVNTYYQNLYLINSSFSGSTENVTGTILHQNSLVEFTGAPKTSIFTINGMLNNKNMGLGFYVIREDVNFIEKTSAKISYSYKVNFNKYSNIALGSSVGFRYQTIDFEHLNAVDKTEQILYSIADNRPVFDGDFGLSYQFKNITTGISASNILRKSTIYLDNNGNANFSFKTVRSYNGFVMYNYEPYQDIVYKPILLMTISDGLPVSVRLDNQLIYKQNYFLGANYTIGKSVGFNVGLKPHENITLNYGYESMVLNSPVHFSTHEVMISYNFRQKSKSEIQQEEIEQNGTVERIDYLEDKTNKIKDDVEIQKKRIDSHEKDLKLLKSVTLKDSAALSDLINQSGVSLKDSKESKVESGETLEKTYYVVLNAFKEFENAKKYQGILKREVSTRNFIKRDLKDEFYLICTGKYKDEEVAKREHKKISAMYDGTRFVYGNVWIYSE